jgi:hypothetical protein
LSLVELCLQQPIPPLPPPTPAVAASSSAVVIIDDEAVAVSTASETDKNVIAEVGNDLHSYWSSWVNWSELIADSPTVIAEEAGAPEFAVQDFADPIAGPMPAAPADVQPHAVSEIVALANTVTTKTGHSFSFYFAFFWGLFGITLVCVIPSVVFVGMCFERLRRGSDGSGSIITTTTTTTMTTTTAAATTTTTHTTTLTTAGGAGGSGGTEMNFIAPTPTAAPDFSQEQIQALFSNTVMIAPDSEHVPLTSAPPQSGTSGSGATPAGDMLVSWDPTAPQISPLFVQEAAPPMSVVRPPNASRFEPDSEQSATNAFSPSVLLYPFYTLMRLSPSNLLRLVWERARTVCSALSSIATIDGHCGWLLLLCPVTITNSTCV